MMPFTRHFLPLLRINGRKEGVAIECLVDFSDDQAVGQV
ncbi:MAG: hypothetical protein JWQ23_4426, partial [Herminiimonas sp.]|nr:hypothetical protein [Herminiimonas sp.]